MSCGRALLARANTIESVDILLAKIRNQRRALEFRQSVLAAVGRYSFMAMKIVPDLWTGPAFTFADHSSASHIPVPTDSSFTCSFESMPDAQTCRCLAHLSALGPYLVCTSSKSLIEDFPMCLSHRGPERQLLVTLTPQAPPATC